MNNEMMTCEVCGKQKQRSEMSKSYPHRCKACVAEHTKEVCRAAKDENRSQQVKLIDWEQRRYEVAKEAVRGVALTSDEFTDIEIKTTVANAVQLADALIEELKKEVKDDEATK